MATTTRVRLTEFLLNPDLDESRLELIDGEVTEKPMPNFGHGRVALLIGGILNRFGVASVEARAVIDAAGASLIPDVVFYRDGEPGDLDYMRNPPHVAIEIMSPGQSSDSMRRKAALYFTFGVESVWIVNLARNEIHVLEGGQEQVLTPGQRLTTPAVPGLDVDIADLLPGKP